MNLISNAPATAEKKVLEQIAYQTALYFPLDHKELSNCNDLQSILNRSKEILQNEIEEGKTEDLFVDPEYIEGLEAIIGEDGSYPELGKAMIGNKSWTKESGEFDSQGFLACTFTLPKGNGEINVCFRGTPDGAWIDNGYGMAGGEYLIPYENTQQGVTNLGVSPMQHNALEYMQSIIDKNEGKTINISGHSKGGNETQLAALVFADKINAAYNFDGQGFPPDVVEQLQNLPDWEEGLTCNLL